MTIDNHRLLLTARPAGIPGPSNFSSDCVPCRVVGIAGPAAIIVISIVVGGLIVSVMTALMSVSQIIG